MLSDFGVFRDACLSYFLSCFRFAGMDHENTGYVKFVDRIEKLADFLENKAMDLEKSCKFRVLEYAVFLMTCWASFLRFWGSF